MHVDLLRQEVGNRRDVANRPRGVNVGLREVRLFGEELPRPHTPRRMIVVEITDARQAQEPVRIVSRLWVERAPVGPDRLDVTLQLLPAGEAVASGEHTLRVMQRESSRVGRLFVPLDFGDGVGVAGTVGFEQLLRLALELVEVGSVGPLAIAGESRIGHNDLLSWRPVSASRAERRFVSRSAVASSIAVGWTQSSPRTRQRPDTLPNSLRVLMRRVNRRKCFGSADQVRWQRVDAGEKKF